MPTPYNQFVQVLNAAHALLEQNGERMHITDNDDRGPHIINLCTAILVQWYEYSGVEYQDLANAMCQDITTCISDMLYHREQEMRAQENQG